MKKQLKSRNVHVGMVFDVWWEIVEIYPRNPKNSHYKVKLRNKANGMEVIISNDAIYHLMDGVTTVSSIICTLKGWRAQSYFRRNKGAYNHD